MIYAYSPYKVQIPLDPTSIPIKISPIAAETPFYKYGRLSQGQKEVNRKSPLAKLSMNYALSLLSFEIYQDSNINGLFKLTSIQIGNRAGGNTLQYTGTMDIVTGNIKGTPGAHKATLLTIDPSVTLRHAKAEEQNIRIVPTYSPIREKKLRRSLLSMEELTNTSFRKAPVGIKDINTHTNSTSMVRRLSFTT